MLAAGGYQHIRFGSIKLSPRKEMEEDSADIPMKVVYSDLVNLCQRKLSQIELEPVGN